MSPCPVSARRKRRWKTSSWPALGTSTRMNRRDGLSAAGIGCKYRLQVSAIGYQPSAPSGPDRLPTLRAVSPSYDLRLTTYDSSCRLAVRPSGRLLLDSSTLRLLDSPMTPLLAMVRANLK